MDYEQIVMTLIAAGGSAKSKSMEAIASARQGDILEARRLLVDADRELVSAHDVQNDLIMAEASGNPQPVSILMVHAQDHLMSAMLVKDLATEFISLYEAVQHKAASLD